MVAPDIGPASGQVSARPPDPPAGHARRRSVARLVGLLGIVAIGASFMWLTTDPAFSVDPARVRLQGLRYTDPAAVRGRMNMRADVRPATVIISTRSMEAALEELPTVAAARVRAILPNDLTVTLTEREPMVAWRVGEDGQDAAAGWLMDVDGVAFAPIALATDEELGDGSTGSALPAVDDLRAEPPLTLGGRLDLTDIAALRTLGNVTPDLVDSSATALFLSLDDDDGWVLSSPGHWRAVFGHYSQTLASPDRIPYQVQCLKALLAARERTVDEVTLAVSPDRCGTFVSRHTGTHPAQEAHATAGGHPSAGPDASTVTIGDTRPAHLPRWWRQQTGTGGRDAGPWRDGAIR